MKGCTDQQVQCMSDNELRYQMKFNGTLRKAGVFLFEFNSEVEVSKIFTKCRCNFINPHAKMKEPHRVEEHVYFQLDYMRSNQLILRHLAVTKNQLVPRKSQTTTPYYQQYVRVQTSYRFKTTTFRHKPLPRGGNGTVNLEVCNIRI